MNTPIQPLTGLPGPGELAESLGIVIVEADRDRVVATMPVAGNRQPYGLLHGGASAALAETLGSVHGMLLAGDGNMVVGVDLSCTHHRGLTDGTVTGTSTAIHAGRTVETFEIVIRDESDRRVCTARLTCLVRPIPAAAP